MLWLIYAFTVMHIVPAILIWMVSFISGIHIVWNKMASHLNSRLSQIDSHSQIFSREHIRVVGLSKRLFQFFQLKLDKSTLSSNLQRRIQDKFWGVHFDQTVLTLRFLDRQALANRVDPDQTPQNAASDQGLHCLPLNQQFYHHENMPI